MEPFLRGDRAQRMRVLARPVLRRACMKTPHAVKIGLVASLILSPILGGALLGGCASSGTEPHAMTAGEHQAAASREGQTAVQHQAQYNAQAAPEPRRAPPSGTYAACISYENSNCYVRWRSEQNPTDQHRKEAEQHRKLAEKHRAASQALVDAEKRFCSGMPESDRDTSPFYHREDIAGVEGLKKETLTNGNNVLSSPTVVRVLPIEKEGLGAGLFGARITFRAVPGMTSEWLQRVVDCHLARNAVVTSTEDMNFCPLAVPHVAAIVSSTGSGFAVDVTSDNEYAALEVIKRAQGLAPGSPTIDK